MNIPPPHNCAIAPPPPKKKKNEQKEVIGISVFRHWSELDYVTRKRCRLHRFVKGMDVLVRVFFFFFFRSFSTHMSNVRLCIMIIVKLASWPLGRPLDLLSGRRGKNFSIAIFSDAISVINIKLCMTELHPVHTTFSDLDHISRSQLCQFTVRSCLAWLFLSLLRQS